LNKTRHEALGQKANLVERWFVYILRCADGSLYTGITNDVSRRCERHNAGAGSRYTRSRLPIRMEYQEPHATRGLALKRELAIKALSRPEKEALIRSSISTHKVSGNGRKVSPA
jgi:predicted GIY-YIG superfamily endonuclease